MTVQSPGGGGGPVQQEEQQARYRALATLTTHSTVPHRKREIRLMKNREAARECRNKKKEYIKCLENR